MTVYIREELPTDVRGIDSLIREVFGNEDEVRLVQLLRDRGELVVSLVAVASGEIIGHVAASPATVGDENKEIVGIAPLSVRGTHRRQGIGSSLMSAVLEKVKELDYVAAVLLGDPDYYPRFGFKIASQFNLDNEYNATDAFMAIEIQSGALASVNGTVQYSSAFSDCSARGVG